MPLRKTWLSSGVLCLCLVPALVGWPARALAQAGDKAAAEVLFNEGRQQMQEGKLDSACDKLAESQRLDPGAGTLLNLAECRERQGRTATAWATWLEAAAAAHTAGQSEREAHARKRAEGLKPRLVTLTLEVPEASRISGLEVSRDGVALGAAMWGVAVPVDPGAHTLTAKASGREPWTQTVSVV
ncbi:MAG TPA: hypothetical protein VFQ61_34390, partial [Polyangiaceae bacterium]|nr:hypothetical protein [Polyangiaceae bacterium]